MPAERTDARRNREAVLRTAMRVFMEEGLEVPLTRIAQRAGVGAGTVYRHFPSKEALFQAVVLERIQQFAEEARALAAAEDPGEVFVDYFVRVIRQASLNRAICDALAESSGHAFKAGAGEEFRAALAELLTRAQAAGVIRPDINGDDLRALIAGCLAVERYAPGSGHLVRVVIDGLKASGPAASAAATTP